MCTFRWAFGIPDGIRPIVGTLIPETCIERRHGQQRRPDPFTAGPKRYVTCRQRGLHYCRAVGLGVVVLVLGLALSATAYGDGVSTDALLNATRAAIATQTSAHVVFTAHSGSTGATEMITADVGTSSGTEDISEGSAAVTIRVTPSFAYVSGTSAGLIKLFGLNSAEARGVGRKWESWPAGTGQYRNLRSDVTMPSVTALLPKAKGTTVSTKAAGGMGQDVLHWTTAATASVPRLSNTLTIPSRGPVLPLSVVATASGGTKITTLFSKWGEVVVVPAPAAKSVISSSKVGG
jgi:hypothetical protein